MRTQGQRPRVLLIDEHRDDWELYCVGLAAEGFDVTVAASATEGARHAGRCALDAVVVHLGTIGWEMADALTRDTAAPVAVITGQVRPDGVNRERVRRSGFAAFIAKPCTPSALAGGAAPVAR